MRSLNTGFVRTLAIYLTFVLMSGCVHLVASYNSETQGELTKLSSDVLGFYQTLLEKPPTNRPYLASQKAYGDIETEMRVFYIKQSSVSKNQSSIDLTKGLLDRWEKHQKYHKESGKYPDGELIADRNDFQAIFKSLFQNEEAKKMASDSGK
ncbi:hypothetical protein [Paraburkholderia phytofirmans]|uniref:hypothetical protein n=1 Tax=Paraburkholderia phytofirmans TaxID=261302 RepID=UPI0038BC5185